MTNESENFINQYSDYISLLQSNVRDGIADNGQKANILKITNDFIGRQDIDPRLKDFLKQTSQEYSEAKINTLDYVTKIADEYKMLQSIKSVEVDNHEKKPGETENIPKQMANDKANLQAQSDYIIATTIATNAEYASAYNQANGGDKKQAIFAMIKGFTSEFNTGNAQGDNKLSQQEFDFISKKATEYGLNLTAKNVSGDKDEITIEGLKIPVTFSDDKIAQKKGDKTPD